MEQERESTEYHTVKHHLKIPIQCLALSPSIIPPQQPPFLYLSALFYFFLHPRSPWDVYCIILSSSTLAPVLYPHPEKQSLQLGKLSFCFQSFALLSLSLEISPSMSSQFSKQSPNNSQENILLLRKIGLPIPNHGSPPASGTEHPFPRAELSWALAVFTFVLRAFSAPSENTASLLMGLSFNRLK